MTWDVNAKKQMISQYCIILFRFYSFLVFYCFYLSFDVFLLGFLVINVITQHFEMLSGFLYAGIFCWIYDTL